MSLRTLSIILICTSGLAFAHGGATGIVKERMDGMLDLGRAMKALSAEVKSDTPDMSVVRQIGEDIVAQSGARLVARFPEGSLDKPSEASAEIWTQPDAFQKLADELERMGAELAQAETLSQSDLSSRFRALGENCKACHQDFRIEK